MVEVIRPVITGELIATGEADLFYGFAGGLQGARIDLLGGDDRLDGTNIDDLGVGIKSSIVFGNDGDDIIIGNATGVSSIGISDSLIRGGAGNDIIIAEGTGAGIAGTILDGDEGDDIIRVKSGFGTVNGGDGNDRIRLEGVFDDYLVTAIFDVNDFERDDGGEIVISDDVTSLFKVEGVGIGTEFTELLVINMEEFLFEGDGSVLTIPDLVDVVV